MSESPRYCHLCGQRVNGTYFVYGRKLIVCSRCQTERPRCVRCGVPLAEAQAKGSTGGAAASATFAHTGSSALGHTQLLCPSCEQTALRCTCCHEVITGTYYRFDELVTGAPGRHFCARCAETHPRCDLCRAPVPSPALPLLDGQYRCALCASQMVTRVEEAERLYSEALRAFVGVVGDAIAQPPTLALVGRRQMGEVRRQAERAAGAPVMPGGSTPTESADGAGYHVLGFFFRAGSAATIYAEVGLPRPLLLGTLAHEIGHAWQAAKAPEVRDPLLCEGFAEWVAHHVLVARGHQMLAERATRRDDLYGRGLRAYLHAEQLGGRRAVLALMGGHASDRTTDRTTAAPRQRAAHRTRPVAGA